MELDLARTVECGSVLVKAVAAGARAGARLLCVVYVACSWRRICTYVHNWGDALRERVRPATQAHTTVPGVGDACIHFCVILLLSNVPY